jgi:hypothetical protein
MVALGGRAEEIKTNAESGHVRERKSKGKQTAAVNRDEERNK